MGGVTSRRSTKDSTTNKHPHPSTGSLKKSLTLAAVAASLGVSLGVPVADVLAANVKLESPPTPVSRQDKHNVSSEQLKYSNQLKQSNQLKIESSQFKDKTQTPQTMQGR